jgi:uncharacterized membrane protein
MNQTAPTQRPNEHPKLTRWRENVVELLIIVGGLVAVNLIFIPKAFRQSHTVDPESAAQLGAFVGGYVGATFALVGVVLLYSTLL